MQTTTRKIAEFFYEDDEEIDYPTHAQSPPRALLRKPSSFTPDTGRDLASGPFIKGVSSEIMLESQRNIFCNLRKEEKEGLRELRNNEQIKPADKGGAVVVMETTDCIGECTRQLDNTTYYRIFTSDPTNSFNKKNQEAIDKGIEEKEISSEIGKALLVPHPTPGRFYILLKIYKEGNPGRPIIGGDGCPAEIISQFVDYHMKDLVSQLPSYVQDDMDFLRKIHDINKTGPLPPDTLLCTMDVSALYSNISHKEGTDACRIALEEGRQSHTVSHLD